MRLFKLTKCIYQGSLISVIVTLIVLYNLMSSSRDLHYSYSSLEGEPPELRFHVKPAVTDPYEYTRRLPQALIIGVAFGGTRALSEWMSVSPLFTAPRNPTHFFCDDNIYAKGLQWYRDQMPKTLLHQVTAERDSSYLTCESAVERVYKMNPKMKLIIIMRDPTKRLVSDYTNSLNMHKGNSTFPSFEELVFVNGSVRTSWDAVDRSLYYKHVGKWLKRFPRTQLHIVDGDLFLRDPAIVMRGAEKFLGMENHINRTFYEYDANRGYFCRKYANKTKLCLADKRTRTIPEIKFETLALVQEFYRKPNQMFFDLIQQWLPYWD